MKLRRLLLQAVLWLGSPWMATADDQFHAPVPLQADGKVINTSDNGGHSGPCLVDVDQDGLRDLVVGDFSGKFRYFRNVGSASSPEYSLVGYLQADGSDAEVNIYCCVGSSPFFGDLNGDGTLDMVSGCYSPGTIWKFPGTNERDHSGRLAKPTPILDKHGVAVRHPGAASWPSLFDWDADGDLDLIHGDSEGRIGLRANIGSSTAAVFDSQETMIEITNEIGQLTDHVIPKGHAAVAMGDWDRDGLPDLLSGSYNGGVYLLRNIGTLQKPHFQEPEAIVPPPMAAKGHGLLLPRIEGGTPKPGIRSQIFVVDYDQDGWLDLLVGDYMLGTQYTLRSDITETETAEFERLALHKHRADLDAAQAFSNHFITLPKRDSITPEEFRAFYTQEKAKWEKEPPQVRTAEELTELQKDMAQYLKCKDDKPKQVDEGYVWLYLRKPPIDSPSRTE
ncbi:VCBS repeat-containing protein [Bremerella sp. JC770]|uniref:FG-GAP repeat domain-containing protein n=1 Tax=Bremerella sp. JC770 TaxID=3232137 RepID=UPI003459BA4B